MAQYESELQTGLYPEALRERKRNVLQEEGREWVGNPENLKAFLGGLRVMVEDKVEIWGGGKDLGAAEEVESKN